MTFELPEHSIEKYIIYVNVFHVVLLKICLYN